MPFNLQIKMIQRPTTQNYSQYTAEDFAVWRLLFNRQMELLRPHVSEAYLQALTSVGFTADRIPDFEEVNKRLAALTGWGLQVVPNICPDPAFFQFLSRKRFTATCWLRTMEQLDYLEEPDMFHDVFAHVPLLSNQAYVGFFKGISDIALKYIDNPKAIELLSAVYWFTIEFGLMREKGRLKIYGAGIISSKNETVFCMSKEAKHQSFSIEKMMNTPYRTDVLQETYFIIDSFEQLYNSLGTIEALLEKEFSKGLVYA